MHKYYYSSSLSLSLSPASPQILQATSGDYPVGLNEEVRLIVVASAAQELSYQWFRDNQPLPYSTGNELYIKQLQLGDQGVYNCRVSTKLGGSKLTDDCYVHGKDDILYIDRNYMYCILKSSLSLSLSSSCSW